MVRRSQLEIPCTPVRGYYTSARSHACMLMFMHMHADGRSSAAAAACQPRSRSRFNQPPADRFRLPRALQSCCNAGDGRIPFPCVGRRAWCCCWPGRPWSGQRERRPRAAMHAWPGAVGSNVPHGLGPSTTPFPFLLRRSLSTVLTTEAWWIRRVRS